MIETFRSRAQVAIATSVIVAGELRFMVQNSQQRAANLTKVQAFLQRIEIYPIDLAIATIYGEFKIDRPQTLNPKHANFLRYRTTEATKHPFAFCLHPLIKMNHRDTENPWQGRSHY